MMSTFHSRIAIAAVLLLAGAASVFLLVRGDGTPLPDGPMAGEVVEPAPGVISGPGGELLDGGDPPEEPDITGESLPDSAAVPSVGGEPSEQEVVSAPVITETEAAQEEEQPQAEPSPGEAIRLSGRTYLRGTDEPLANVGLEFHVIAPSGPNETQLRHQEAVTTGDDGGFLVNTPVPPGRDPANIDSVYLFFAVTDVPEGGYYYAGSGEAGGRMTPDGPALIMQQVGVANGEAMFNMPFERGLALKGRVLQPDARTPAGGISVTTSTSSGSRFAQQERTTTNSDGEFEMRLAPNSVGHVRAEGERGVARTGFRMPGQGPHPDLVLILAEYGTVEGRVVAPSGQGVANAYIQGATEPATGGEIPFSGTSQEDGSFRFEQVPSGHVEIKALGPTSQPGAMAYFESEPVSFELQAAETHGPVVLMLKDGEEIRVLVLNRDEEPIEGAQLEAQAQNRGVTVDPQRSGEDGRMVIRGIPPGGRLYFIGVNHPDYEEDFRQDVSPLDGEQVFRLAPVHHREMIVRWAEDRSPVSHYSYVMLRKGWNDFNIDRQRGNEVVYSEDGRTLIPALAEGEWRVEAVHLTESGEPTTIRGAAEFHVSAHEEDPEPVEVLITDDRRIEGRVALAESGEPVAGALVDIVPPAMHDPVHFWARPAPSDRHLEPARTDTSGQFEIAGLTAGTYTLTVEHGEYRTQYPVDVIVPTEQDPDFVEIELSRGGVLHGTVIDRDGSPVAGAAIQHRAPNPNYTSWQGRDVTTDSDGRYRIEGLAGGPHVLHLSDRQEGIDQDRRDVDLDFGEVRQVDFDFHNRVRVYGELRTPEGDGQDASIWLSFHPGGEGSASTAHVPPGAGEYEVRLRPGSYTVSATIAGRTVTGEGQQIVVAETPDEQRHDLLLDFAEADVILVYPTDADFSPGLVMIAPEERHRRYGFIRVRMDQEARRTVDLMGGAYRATFTSEDGLWRGESGTVQIGSGHENAFVLDMKRVQRNVPIGNWDPSNITLQPTPLLFDVTPYVQSDGEMTLLLEYERGRNAAVTLWAKLYENGEEISSRHHEGWSGFEKWNNSYRLRLDGYDPAAIYHVEVGLRADGGIDSFGTVYLNMN